MAKTSGSLGSNIAYELDGKKLVITIDLTTTLGNSKSGKNVLVASSGGNASIPGTDVKIGLNAYKPVKA